MTKICIDPGHGLPDPGAVAGNLKEYELTLEGVDKVTCIPGSGLSTFN